MLVERGGTGNKHGQWKHDATHRHQEKEDHYVQRIAGSRELNWADAKAKAPGRENWQSLLYHEDYIECMETVCARAR